MPEVTTDRPTTTQATNGRQTGLTVSPATAAPIAPEPPEEEGDGGVMTLREHLIELRDRLVKSVLGVAAGSVVGFILGGRVLEYFANLICQHGDIPGTTTADCRLQIIDPVEGIVTYFKVAVYIGVALGLPIVVYQLVRFMAPGLTRSEKRLLYTSLPFVSVLFAAGAAFALTLVLPAMLGFLAGFMRDIFRADFRASNVLSLALSITLWMGLIFEMPLVMVILTRLGVVHWRRLLSWWRYAVVIIMVVAAVVTPTPDPINMMIVATPMLLLYALGVFLSRLFARKEPALAAGA